MDDSDENQDPELETFGRLVREHQASVRAFILSRMNDPFEAHDLAQETFLVAYRKIGEIDTNRPIRPWLMGIALGLVRNHWRKHRAQPVGIGDEITALLEARIADEKSVWKEGPVFEALEHCEAKLGESARQLLRLRYEEGLEISEIVSSAGAKHSAITMKLHRLREKLRDCIENRLGKAVAYG